MKIVKLEWGYMTDSVLCPVLERGYITSLVGWENGTHSIYGMFPTMYAVASDNAIVTHYHGSTKDRPRRALIVSDLESRYKIVLFKSECRAKRVVTQWVTGKNTQQFDQGENHAQEKGNRRPHKTRRSLASYLDDYFGRGDS